MEMMEMPAEAFPGFPEGDFLGFGYCWMHHFKCHSARTCDTWAGGGPISEDEGSHGWQDKSPFQQQVLEDDNFRKRAEKNYKRGLLERI